MASNSYKRIAAVRPAGLAEAQWFEVPAEHQYVGNIRICNQSALSVTFSLAHTDAPGAATGEDWEFFNYVLGANDSMDITKEMGAAETLRYVVSIVDIISFVFTGLDQDIS